MTRYDTYDDFLHDLDESSKLSDDPFGVDSEIGSLDEDDLALLGAGAAKPAAKKKPPAKPKAKRKPR